MATYSTGITVIFEGTELTEVVGLSWSLNRGDQLTRDGGFPGVYGTVAVAFLSEPGPFSFGFYGSRGILEIAGGGVALTVKAVCRQLNVQAQRNGVTRYDYVFDVLGG